MRLVSARDVVDLLVAVLLQQGDEEAVAWVQGPGAAVVAEQARAIVDVLRRKGSGGRSGESTHDPELPPEVDPFEGLREPGVPMSALAERAASIVYGRYFAHLPAGVRGLAAALYGAKMVDILLTVEGFGLSGIGGWRGQRGFEAKVDQMMGATDPARTLGRAPPTLRTEDQAADWLRTELATMGLSDLSVSVSVERPRYSNYWSATLELRGERIHGGADTKSGALADVVNKPAVWAVCANEIVRRAGFVFPTRDEWNAQRSTAGSVALGAREDQERAKVARETKARQAYEAAWTATAERYIALSKEARRIVAAIRARAAAKGREDSANLHDAKAVTAGTGWTVTSGKGHTAFGGVRYALRFDGDDRFYWDNYGRGGAGKIETYWADQTVEDTRKARANRQMIHGFREPPEPRGYWTKGDADLEEYLADLRRFESGRVYRENGRGGAVGAGVARANPTHYPFLSLDVTELAAKAAADRKVSEVARGPGGFLSAYRRADGHADSLHGMAHASGQPWTDRRAGFIARHMAQAGPLWERDPKGGERPTRRHLALAVWAYSPDAGRLRRWLRGRYV